MFRQHLDLLCCSICKKDLKICGDFGGWRDVNEQK